jgi:hypothetical protein
MPILRILCYNGSLVTWTVVSLTTAKFKPLTFSTSGFTLSYTANIFILMILYDFCLLRAQFCYLPKSKSKLCYDWRSAGQSVLEKSTHLGLTTRSWLLSDSCGFVDLGRPLWREDGSVVCNCYWSSPAQSFLGPSPVGLVVCLPGLGPHYIASGRTQQKTSFSNNPFIVACVFVAAGTCLPSRFLTMNVYSGSIIPAFRRNVTILRKLCGIVTCKLFYEFNSRFPWKHTPHHFNRYI